VLVAESSRRSNLRVLYGILAQSALEQFVEPRTHDVERTASFLNLIRLLDMYQYGSFQRTSPRAVLDRRQIDLKELKHTHTESLAIEAAMQAAHDAVYPTLSRAQLVESLKLLFSRVSKNEFHALSSGELKLAQKFLKEFTKALGQ